jgi:hypothetical protein
MSTQPKQDAPFIAWAKNISTQCGENMTAWNLDTELLNRLETLTGTADETYLANENPELKNRFTAAQKRAAFTELKVFLGTYVYVLLADTDIPDEAIDGMDLPPRKHHYHGPLPAPAEAPEPTAIVGQHHDVTVYVAVEITGQPVDTLTKKGYHGFIIRYKKEDEAEWHEEYSTRLHVILYFDAEDQGKNLQILVAWINPRLQHGPWSDETVTMIN